MRYYLFFLAIVCTSAIANAGGTTTHGKPRSPLQVSISPVQAGLVNADIKPNDVVEFKIAGTALVDAGELKLNVDLHGGIELLSGETTWVGPAVKGEAKFLLITVKVPKHGNGMIRARLTASPSSGASFAAETEYRFGKYAEKKPAVLPEIKKDNKGRAIREYRVN